jgi:hypothetical protein
MHNDSLTLLAQLVIGRCRQIKCDASIAVVIADAHDCRGIAIGEAGRERQRC